VAVLLTGRWLHRLNDQLAAMVRRLTVDPGAALAAPAVPAAPAAPAPPPPRRPRRSASVST
jgi:hypothetical protein